jgi:hypothetical protein
MKRILAAAVAAASISAFAAWERVGSVQIADAKTQGEAAAKIGQMVGNPFAAAAIGAALADVPTVKFFGPAREGASTLLTLFLDGDAVAKSPGDALDDLEYAVLYPVSLSRADFLKRHEGAAETNGVVVVKGDLSGEDADSETTYVAFSRDGKWAGASDKAEQAKLALRDVKLAEKHMKGEVARLRVSQKGVKALALSLKAQAKSAEDADEVRQIEAVTSFSCGLKVSGLGLDLNFSVSFEDGSEFAKCGLKPLGENPLAFASAEAVEAAARAEDSGCSKWESDEKWNALLDVFRKHGVDLGRFLVREKKDAVTSYTVDIEALFKFLSGEAEETLGKIDTGKLLEDVQKLSGGEKFAAKSPASFDEVRVKGFKPQWTVAERFAATMPDAAAKKPFYVSFTTISSFLKATVPHGLSLVPEEQRDGMKPILETFAEEAKPGVAIVGWRPKDGGTMRFTLRVSSDEVRCVGGVVSAAMMGGFGFGDGDDDDGEDED